MRKVNIHRIETSSKNFHMLRSIFQIFLGTLRAAEFEHLMERFWYALTETCLAFTVFRDDFNPKFIALFTVLLFLKSFHWLAEDRVDYVSIEHRVIAFKPLINFVSIFILDGAESSDRVGISYQSSRSSERIGIS